MLDVALVVLAAILTLFGGILLWRWTRERRVVQVSTWSSTPTRIKSGVFCSQTVRYENIGNKAIKGLEIAVDLDGGTVENITLDRLTGLIDSEGGTLRSTVPLLNPGEAVQLLLTTTECKVKGTARAEDVEVRYKLKRANVFDTVAKVIALIIAGAALIWIGLIMFGVVQSPKSPEQARHEEVMKRLDRLEELIRTK